MNNQTPRLVVVEDEPSIQNFLVQELNKFENVSVVGRAKQIDEAFQVITEKQPDALFLDIKLIGGDAFQLINRLVKSGFDVPHIALCTGFPEYAIDALNDYRRYVVKYLMKPLDPDWQLRLNEIVDEFWVLKRANLKQIPIKKASTPDADSIFVASEGQFIRIDFDNILWLEAAGSGASYVVTDVQDIKVELSLLAIRKKLDDRFCQISRNNIVNLTKIQAVNRSERYVTINRMNKLKELNIGDVFYNTLLESLGIKLGQSRVF